MTGADQTGGGDCVAVRFPAEDASGRPLDGVALVLLDRPRALNALNEALLSQLVAALRELDEDVACRCIVIAGAGERAFAAGADIREMADETPASLRLHDRFARWDEIAAIHTPMIAAIRGYALGGGLELALGCDMILAGDDAVFGQPEINLGIIPGAGGTQRLTRAIGKARATELILTGRTVTATEAERLGFVTRVVPAAETVPAALELAAIVAGKAPLAVLSAVDAIRAADELPLSAGVAHERRDFHLLFGTEDQREGMAAFLEKRRPSWKGR
ncbi:MAG TPA: enoyl-CoA hydratase-related protein [Candidatus Limnocylindrales bacterium]